MPCYRFFDLCISSELELPALPLAADAAADWTVTPATAGRTDMAWLHRWQTTDGRTLMAGARDGENCVLDFPGLARFSIDFDQRRLAAAAHGTCAPETLAHLLLDQVLPRVVCHQGRVVLHASSVALPDGGVVAFAGQSGRGKSTLASAFHRAGLRVLGDDCLLTEQRGGELKAIPAYASMRLWPDAADALFSKEEQYRLCAVRMAHYADKRVLQPVAPAGPDEPLPLRALYLLETLDASRGMDAVRIERIRGMAAIMALVEAQFTLDLVDPEAVKRGFRAVETVARGAAIYRLEFPRRFDILPRVVETILGIG